MRVRAGWFAVFMCLLVAGPGAVAAAAEPFSPVPEGHWSYAAVRELGAAGYFTGHPEGTFDGSRALTRYDFAVAVGRLIREAERMVAALGPPGRPVPGRSSAHLRLDLETIQRLAREYASELGMTGAEFDQVRQQARALVERLDRLDRQAPPAAQRPPTPPAGREPGEDAIPGRSGLPGFRSLTVNLAALTRPDVPGPPGPFAPSPLLTAEIQAPDPLHLAPGRSVLEPPAERLAILARLSLPWGRYGFSGYYRRVGEGYLSPDSSASFQALAALRGLEGFGGALSAPITDRLALSLEGAVYHDPHRKSVGSARYFRGGVNWALSDRLFLDVAYERLVSAGLGADGADGIYQIGLQRQLSPHVSFGVLYQIHQQRRGLLDHGASVFDVNQHSAMTRFTVRF